MAYSLQTLLMEVQALGIGNTFPYITSEQKLGRLESVDGGQGRISFTFINNTVTPAVSETGGFSQDKLQLVAAALSSGSAVNIDAVLNGGGNKRSVLEAFLAHTEHMFVCYVNGAKHLFRDEHLSHEIGQLYYSAPNFVACPVMPAEQMESEFKQWLVQQPSRGQSGLLGASPAATYCEGLQTCLTDPVFSRLFVKNLFEVQDVKCFETLFNTIKKVPGYGAYNLGWNNQALNAAMDRYLKYLQWRSDNVPSVSGMAATAGMPTMPLQQIRYGAPGTGKSYGLNEDIVGNPVRVTFHPDSDYSTFVGAYKPTMVEGKIEYRFVDQAFLKAYVRAWSDLSKPQFLLIEEINRGNCAQVFGDLFQLLDRDDEGFSKYPIDVDHDIETFLAGAFANINIEDAGVKSGVKMVLPNNLYILATMNTSDQSLFPMDSAFKRRWDWQYVPICEGVDKVTKQPLGWKIKFGDCEVDWWKFLLAVNKVVKSVTNSADKQLGYFFVKAKDAVIDAEMFVNKVAFYLWNDVFKDCELDGEAFKIERDGQADVLAFQDFFTEGGAIDEAVLKNFLTKLVPPPEAAQGGGATAAAG